MTRLARRNKTKAIKVRKRKIRKLLSGSMENYNNDLQRYLMLHLPMPWNNVSDNRRVCLTTS